jgi:hypothetical protein
LHLTVIGGEHDVGVVRPRPGGNGVDHSAAGLIDQFVHDVHLGVHFADLIMGQSGRYESRRASFHVGESTVPIGQPVRRLAGQDGADVVIAPRMTGGQSQVLP